MAVPVGSVCGDGDFDGDGNGGRDVGGGGGDDGDDDAKAASGDDAGGGDRLGVGSEGGWDGASMNTQVVVTVASESKLSAN